MIIRRDKSSCVDNTCVDNIIQLMLNITNNTNSVPYRNLFNKYNIAAVFSSIQLNMNILSYSSKCWVLLNIPSNIKSN